MLPPYIHFENSYSKQNNEYNGVMTMVVPDDTLFAGIWNNIDFPTPVPITTNMGLSCFIMTSNADFYNLRNCVPAPNMSSNDYWMSNSSSSDGRLRLDPSNTESHGSSGTLAAEQAL
jgi:hypothetical protein